jgi:hypothetical protein
VDKTLHPLLAWCIKHYPDGQGGVNWEALSRQCRKLGRPVKAVYLKQVVWWAHYAPSFELSRFLGEDLTGGDVSWQDIYTFQYSRQPSRRA